MWVISKDRAVQALTTEGPFFSLDRATTLSSKSQSPSFQFSLPFTVLPCYPFSIHEGNYALRTSSLLPLPVTSTKIKDLKWTLQMMRLLLLFLDLEQQPLDQTLSENSLNPETVWMNEGIKSGFARQDLRNLRARCSRLRLAFRVSISWNKMLW